MQGSIAEIGALQEKFNITRKSAIRRFEKAGKKIVLTAGFTQKNEGVTVAGVVGVDDKTMVVVPDFKAQAANDDTNANPPASTTIETEKKAETPNPPAPSTPAGDARKEGIRLFQLAGKPSKADFIHVYGEMGAKWTWVARAKAVGLSTPEEAAKQFQAMRAKPSGSCVVVKEEPKEKK